MGTFISMPFSDLGMHFGVKVVFLTCHQRRGLAVGDMSTWAENQGMTSSQAAAAYAASRKELQQPKMLAEIHHSA